MKNAFFLVLMIFVLAASPLAHGRGGPSEVFAGSILITGSVALIMSTLPLIALDFADELRWSDRIYAVTVDSMLDFLRKCFSQTAQRILVGLD